MLTCASVRSTTHRLGKALKVRWPVSVASCWGVVLSFGEPKAVSTGVGVLHDQGRPTERFLDPFALVTASDEEVGQACGP